MPEDMGDRTEAPTPRRRMEAREQGNIARSPDIVAAALLLGVMYTLHTTGPGLVRALKALMTEVLSHESFSNTSTADLGVMIVAMVKAVAVALAPLLLVALFVAIVVNILQ